MSEPKLFTEDEVREIVKDEVMKHLKVTGWAGAVDNGCGYHHVQGGADAYWDKEKIGDTHERPELSRKPVSVVY